jgi:hypothetical protein
MLKELKRSHHTELLMKSPADAAKSVTFPDRPVQISCDEARIVREVARGQTWDEAFRLVFPYTPAEKRASCISEYRHREEIRAALRRERFLLSDVECVTRAEKRHVLSKLIRDVSETPHDLDVVLKAIQLDNRMTGDDEVRIVHQEREAYVVRAGDVIDVEEDVVG